MVTHTSLINKQEPAPAPVPMRGRIEWEGNKFKYSPSLTPNPLSINSLNNNADTIRAIFADVNLKESKRYGYRPDEITFFTLMNKEEGLRYNPHRRERIKNNKEDLVKYDDLIPLIFDNCFKNMKGEQDHRVLGHIGEAVIIRVNENELAIINEEGGDVFKCCKSTKRFDEYQLHIPLTNILQLIFVKK